MTDAQGAVAAQEVRLSERFVQAVAFAAAVHDGQTRKGTAVPYLAHVLAVASLVLEDGGDEDEAIAGLLHDTLEDGEQEMHEALSRIRATFGERVASIVTACSDVDITDTASRSAGSWAARKQHTIDALADADTSATRVMLADKLHNVRSVLTDLAEHGPSLWDRFNAGRDDQLWYYAALAESARSRFRSSRLIRELGRAVEHLREAARPAPPPLRPSGWDPAVEVADPCGDRNYTNGKRCRRPSGHPGNHATSPRPGDV